MEDSTVEEWTLAGKESVMKETSEEKAGWRQLI